MTDDPNHRSILHIASNADDRFFPGLAVAVASTVAAASGRYDYHFWILDGGIAPSRFSELYDRVSRIAEKKSIRIAIEQLRVNRADLENFPERRGSRMTYAKLILPDRLPHLESIIYLDADVLCFKGLESVHPPEGEDHRWLLAGAQDYFGTLGKDCPWINRLSRSEKRFPYINCGIQWINLKAMRDTDFTHEAARALASIDDVRYGDQTVFNFLCRGKIHLLPAAINHRTSIGSSLPLCEGELDLNLHYIGSPKPWLGTPKTSNWLAHQLWHQAHRALFPDSVDYSPGLPHDLSAIRRKALLYALFNPSRAEHYRCDLHSLSDPRGILEMANRHWTSQT